MWIVVLTNLIFWIIIYVVLFSFADNISRSIGIEKIITLRGGILIATILGGIIKYLSHFLSGVLFWPEFPNQPMLERCVYSIAYNGSYMLPTIIISSIIMFLISMNYEKLFLIQYEENA